MFNLFMALGVVGVGVVFVTMIILSLRRIVPTNQAHIVRTSRGTSCFGDDSIKVTSGNTYYQFPEWVPVLGTQVTRLSTAVFDLDLPAYEAYDKDKTPFVVDIKSFFRIDNPLLAASRIDNEKELKEQLLGIIQGAARSILAKEDIELIMCERNKYGKQFTDEVAEQLKEWGVKAVKNIELMDVRDTRESKVVENIMAKKKSQIEMESRTTVAINMKKANEAEIEAEKEVNIKQQQARQEVGLRQAEVEKEIGIAQETAKQEVQAQAKITAEKEMEVKQVNTVRDAEIEKEASIVKADAEKNVIEINAQASVTKADADKKVQVLKAEATKQQIELQADADLKVANNTAKGIEAKGEAEAKSLKLKKNAEVAGQITLAEKIGENQEYQNFVIKQKQVEVLGEVGKEQAKNLGNADIKIFANASDVTTGVTQAGGVFSPKNGLNIASLMEALSSSDIGSDLVNSVVSRIAGNVNTDNDNK